MWRKHQTIGAALVSIVPAVVMAGIARADTEREHDERHRHYDDRNLAKAVELIEEGKQIYQLSLRAPKPPKGSFDRLVASRGEALFNGKAGCSVCHVLPIFTEPGWNLRRPEEIGIDAFQAERSPDGGYRTTPLKGLWTHTKGGFFHDGRFATLKEVIAHYDGFFGLGLNDPERYELVEYLKSL